MTDVTAARPNGLDAILSSPGAAREISRGLYTTLPEETSAPYDRKAAMYDAVVGRAFYNRIRSGLVSTVLILNVLHVACDRAAIVSECARTLQPGRGRLFVSALVKSGRWSDAYLSALHRAGEMGAPLTADDLCETVAGSWGVVESTRMQGNMCFVVVRHRG